MIVIFALFVGWVVFALFLPLTRMISTMGNQQWLADVAFINQSTDMKSNPSHGQAAFTLIELMAVITIIVILAALVVGGLGHVNDKNARSRAVVQMALLSKALEDYKGDFGTYPVTANKTGNFAGPTGTNTSSILFKFLYWDSDNDGTGTGDVDQKIYLADLDPGTTANPNKQGWTTGTAGTGTVISDPWGNQYCYRSAQPLTGTTPNAGTQNSDFDLWSMGKDGKTNGTANHADNRDDIRNF